MPAVRSNNLEVPSWNFKSEISKLEERRNFWRVKNFRKVRSSDISKPEPDSDSVPISQHISYGAKTHSTKRAFLSLTWITFPRGSFEKILSATDSCIQILQDLARCNLQLVSLKFPISSDFWLSLVRLNLSGWIVCLFQKTFLRERNLDSQSRIIRDPFGPPRLPHDLLSLNGIGIIIHTMYVIHAITQCAEFVTIALITLREFSESGEL